MGYALGIDLGTTFSAAAVHRGDRVEIVQLGSHGAAIPSVVVLRADNTVLTGEAADRRAASEPDRVARQFKRRLGDSTPLILGGSPQSVEAVTARLLRSVVDQVTQLEGAAPDHVAVTHPANWTEFKLDLLRQSIRMAGLPSVTLLTEPEAAARHYAAQERVPDGATLAVYDLGGGTFDAAVLRKNGEDFQVLGEPEGVERLGGIDFDAAVIAHVRNQVGDALDSLDPGDLAAARLRDECIAAKEALSQDLDVNIPVLLPTGHHQVRLTRTEFEHAIRPSVDETVAALRRALQSAGVTPDDLHAVLLVGGSSRIPLVAEVVSNELGRPVAVDAHPKHSVALGAAQVAQQRQGTAAAAVAASADAPTAAQTPAEQPVAAQPLVEPAEQPVDSDRSRSLAMFGLAALLLAAVVAGYFITNSLTGGDDESSTEAGDDAEIGDEVEGDDGTGDDDAGGDDGSGDSGGSDDGSEEEIDPSATAIADDDDQETTSTTSTTTTTTTTVPPVPAPACDGGLCVEMTDVSLTDGTLRIEWEADGFTPDTNGNHAHFYWGVYDSVQVGSNAEENGAERAPWELTSDQPFVAEDEMLPANRPADADVCVTVANSSHAVINVSNFHCVPFPEG